MSGSPEPHSFAHRQSPWLGNVLLLLGSVALVFCVGELAARAILPAPLPWQYPQTRYWPDRRLGFALRPSQESFTADKPVEINSRGLRGTLVPYEKSPGRLRILFLGDSIAFGFGVSEKEVLSEQVAAILREKGLDVETINAGVPAYNTEQEVSFLEVEGRRYHADWVILVACWNDVSEKAGVKVDAGGWLIDEGTAEGAGSWHESRAFYGLRNGLKRSRLLYSVVEGSRALHDLVLGEPQAELRKEMLDGERTPKLEAGWNRISEALGRFARISTEDGAHALIVAFPIPMALDHPHPNSAYPARLVRMATEDKIPILDLNPAFASSYHGHESLFIAYDGDHPNAAGHRLAAEEVARAILANGRAPEPD